MATELTLPSRKKGAPKQTVAEQFVVMGYVVRERGVPKFYAEKDGVCYAVFMTQIFGDRELYPVQLETVQMMDRNPVEVMVVKMPAPSSSK